MFRFALGMALVASACVNKKAAQLSSGTRTSGLIDASPTPSPSPSTSASPSAAPVLANCREGQRIQLTAAEILGHIPGVVTTENTLLSVTPVFAGELVAARTSSTGWTIDCPSQFVHWYDPLGDGHLQVAVNFQYRHQSGTTYSGSGSIDVLRWTLAPNWIAAGAATYTLTSEGKILMTNGTQSFILPTSIVPGANGSMVNSPRFYGIAKAPDNLALYVIGSAPTGSALYRVHPATGELWTLSLASLGAPTVSRLEFLSSVDLRITSTYGDITGQLPSTPQIGRVLDTPID